MALPLLYQPCTSRTGAALATGMFSLLISTSVYVKLTLTALTRSHPHPPSHPRPTNPRHFSSTPTHLKSHFDTHVFVQRLEKRGMTKTQAEGVMNVLAEVIDESVKGMEATLVSKAEQEKVSGELSITVGERTVAYLVKRQLGLTG